MEMFSRETVYQKDSPVKVQYQQRFQLQKSSYPEATSQTVPRSPWYRYISAGPAPFKNKNRSEIN